MWARFAIQPGAGGERLTWLSLEPSDDVTMEEVEFLLTSASFLLLFDVRNRPQSGLSIMDQRGVCESVCVLGTGEGPIEGAGSG